MTTQSQPRPSLLKRLFLDHPEEVGENYTEHFGVALRYAALLGWASLAALIHALIPALCEKTASTLIKRMSDDMARRHAQGS